MLDSLVSFEFRQMNTPEYILDQSFSLDYSHPPFQVITPEEAKALYFAKFSTEKTNVYVIAGAMKGDEAKGKLTLNLATIDETVSWALATSSTHNAGKGIDATDILGNQAHFSLHLCPATLVNPKIKNYIGKNTQVNLFKLEQEIDTFQTATKRAILNENYNLMVDRFVNLVLPVNRAEDVICVENAMGSTVSGATASFRNAAGKTAPLLEHALYDHKQFFTFVNLQITEFNDKIKHDAVFAELGITDMKSLGKALHNNDLLEKNDRLKALNSKLSEKEKQFFINENPAQYLLDEYRAILKRNLFDIGDCSNEINEHLKQGKAGILEGVQSILLSGSVKYGRNRTAAGTHTAQIIADANIDSTIADYKRILVFKLGNTSVGGNGKTMSGFIRQDQLSRLQAYSSKTNIVHTFEKTASLDAFLDKQQIISAYNEITTAFYKAFHKGYSLHESKVRINEIDCEFSLAEANALFTAYHFGETGETSKRARICRFEDLVETGVVYKTERNALQIRNAVDRAFDLPEIGFVAAYKIVGDYPGYDKNYCSEKIILPGMPLRQEHLTVEHCIPVVSLIPSWNSLAADGREDLTEGTMLHPNLCRYLTIATRQNEEKVIAIANGPKPENIKYIKRILKK